MAADDREAFMSLFGVAPQASASAPGRVNLLGEHTDYNGGFVLPTAIPQRTRAVVARSPDARWRLHAGNLNENCEYEDGETPVASFARYLYGCAEVVKQRGDQIAPLSVYIASDVPIGSGLSSSAALEVAFLRALRELFQLRFDDVELAQLAQQAEIDFAGVRCGILDQMACSLADEQHMLFLDTRTLERRVLPLPQARIIVIDSGVARTLAGSGYNERRAQCEAAARMLGVSELRDVRAHPGDLARVAALPPPLAQRARHVVTENERVLEAARGVDAVRFGELMNASHASLRDDYEVSTPELDQLVHLLQQHAGVYGARLTGAGFGGACVALARPEQATRARQDVLKAYSEWGGEGRLLV